MVKPVSSGLKVRVDDNFLITGKLNEYFYYGENLDLEKDLVFRDTFIYTDEHKASLSDPNCVAENINELDCSKAEQLQIVDHINIDWVRCKNSLGIFSLVPSNLVSACSNQIYEKSNSLTNANFIKPVELRCQSLTPEIMRTWDKKDPPPRPPKPSSYIFEKMNINNQTNKKKLDNSTLSSLIFEFMSFDAMEKNDECVEPKESECEKREKRRTNRFNVLQELVETERSFLSELKMLYDCFMVEDLLNINDDCPKEFNKAQIFEKFKPVINFSTILLKSFETELQIKQNDFLEAKISHCFLENLEQMQTTYAQYGRFHEEIIFILKNVNLKIFQYFIFEQALKNFE
ncbi:dynamin-binding -like [Brachionus plicatilis]|uniref:Dynamin-binding-like n=1 Tax=Brachionus plicatilis TaxID=10195 RepID=A0A3M7P5I5_BRAPC|nr:dynamin-binding -like [Brachionus plicatilis]